MDRQDATIILKVEPQLKKKLSEMAVKEGRTLSSLVRFILLKAIEKKYKP